MYLKKIFLFVVILFVSSCANIPLTKYIVYGPSYPEPLQKNNNIGLINDVCIFRDAIFSDDYFSIEDSIIAESLMIESAKKILEEKGFQIHYQLAPFVGGYKAEGIKQKVAEKGTDEIKSMFPPFFTDELIDNDEQYKKALLVIIKHVQNAIEQNINRPTRISTSDENIHDYLEIIRNRTKCDIICFITGQGFIVPKTKSILQGTSTAIITAAVTLGTISVWAYNVSCIDTYVGLVDLRNAEIVWSNSLRLKQNPISREFYLKNWPKNIFYHLPRL